MTVLLVIVMVRLSTFAVTSEFSSGRNDPRVARTRLEVRTDVDDGMLLDIWQRLATPELPRILGAVESHGPGSAGQLQC